MIDNIFEIEWLALDKNRKKSLMIIMSRAIVPIQITCAYIVPMDLNSFMSVSMGIVLKLVLIINFIFFILHLSEDL